MVQNILTLVIVLAAAGYTIFQLIRMITAPPERRGCISCGLSGSCNRIKKTDDRKNTLLLPGVNK
jgi:hypothetical protein